MIHFTSDLENRLQTIKSRIASACVRAGRKPEEVTLVAVTKNFPPEAIIEAHRSGIRHIGENRVQEAQAKFSILASLTPKPAFHLVGHLQTNKVKQALKLFDIIQSVDSLKLAELLNAQTGQVMPVFLEVNTSGESSKFGLKPEEIGRVYENISRLRKLEIRGLMTVAPVVNRPEEARPYFRLLNTLAKPLGLKELSMGMSDDYEIAVEEGATVIRIGRALFGERRME